MFYIVQPVIQRFQYPQKYPQSHALHSLIPTIERECDHEQVLAKN
jgi:hypothetical protein